MIVITGANGALGRAVTQRLLDRVPADQVAVSVRDPGSARDLAALGVRVRRGDFAEPATLTDAFADASRVLLVSAGTLDDGLSMHRNAIEAAAAAGAERVFYTSHMGTSPTSAFEPMQLHARTEEMLRDSGTAYTCLRNGFYASTLPMLLRSALDTGELRVPEDGPVAWTAHADLAEATAALLATGSTDERTAPLTGPAALDMAAVAEIAADLLGRPIRHVVVDDDRYRDELVGRGLPAHRADMLVGMFAASRTGDFGPADPALGRQLDRPLHTVRDVLASALPVGRPTRAAG